MGIDIDGIRSDAMRFEEDAQGAAERGDLKTEAEKFNAAADLLRTAGDYDGSARDYKLAGHAQQMEGDYEGAAESYEKAGDDASKTNHKWSSSDAQRDYKAAARDHGDAGSSAAFRGGYLEAAKHFRQSEADYTKAGRPDLAKRAGHFANMMEALEAGKDGMDAGKAAGKYDHKKAADLYTQAQADFTKAANIARDLGDTEDAEIYSKKADDAGKKATKEETLEKQEYGLPPHKNPKNRL